HKRNANKNGKPLPSSYMTDTITGGIMVALNNATRSPKIRIIVRYCIFQLCPKTILSHNKADEFEKKCINFG
ncbi:MAG: hypothetical protein ACI9YH_003450, partial [Colwellia sp.]